MRVLVLTQQLGGVPKNSVMRVVPLRDPVGVAFLKSDAEIRGRAGSKVAIKVATVPDNAKYGHEFTGWRNVRSSMPAGAHCGICGARCRAYLRSDAGGRWWWCPTHHYYCNPIEL